MSYNTNIYLPDFAIKQCLFIVIELLFTKVRMLINQSLAE